MNRYTILAVIGGVAAGALHFNILFGVAIGLVLGLVFTPATQGKRVIVEDIATGKIEIQPNDRATQRYIAGRGE